MGGYGEAIAIVAYAISTLMTVTQVMIAATARKPRKVDSKKDLNEGIQINTCSTQERLKVVYGTVKVGGNDVFRSTTGDDQRYMWVVQTLSEG